MRLIAAVRLSRMTKTTTSPDTQPEGLEDYAAREGHTIVATTRDLDVSGFKVPIRERPEVGPWFDRLDEWDGIAGYAIDRMFRNNYDFVTTYHDVFERYGKTLIATSENIDMSTPEGRTMASIRVIFAEDEIRRMSERRRRALNRIRREGRWNGGSAPYGYRPVQVPGGWVLLRDLDAVAVVTRIAADLINGKSARGIARDLNSGGISSPRGKTWTGDVILRMMRSEILRGYVINTVTNEKIRGDDGFPVRRDPIIEDELWFEVQSALTVNSRPHSGRRAKASLLLRVAYCGQCGAVMFSGTSGDMGYSYYKCSRRAEGNGGCNMPSIRADKLDPIVSGTLLDELGTVPMRKKAVSAPDTNASRLAEIDQGIADLEGLITQEPSSAGTYARLIAKMEAEREHLQALPAITGTVTWARTGQTFAQHWEGLDKQGRHNFLLSAGVRILVRHLDAEATAPEDPVRWTDHGRYLFEQRDLPEAAMTPVPDVPGSVIRRAAHGLWLTVYLGDLVELKNLAAQQGS